MNLDKIARELRAQRYRRTPDGVLFPDLRVKLQGVIEYRGWRQHNLVTTEGLGLIAADAFPATLYVALWSNDVTPVAGWTGATFVATAGENTSTSDGYLEANRVTLPDLVGNDPAEFNIRSTGSPITVHGIGLLDGNTRGATTDALFAAARFATVELLDDHDILDVRYAIVTTPTE